MSSTPDSAPPPGATPSRVRPADSLDLDLTFTEPPARRPVLPWLVAAVAVAAALWVTRQNLDLTAELDNQSWADRDLQLQNRALRQQVEAEQLIGRGEVSRLRGAEMAADPARLQVTRLESPDGTQPAAHGVVVWNPVTAEGLLEVTGLVPAAPDEDYQLWLAPAAPAVRQLSGGIIVVSPGTHGVHFSFKSVGPPPGRFTITREPHGGAPKPTGAVVLAGP